MKRRHLVSASAIAAAVAHDPQLRIPKRPRFAPGLVTVLIHDGLLVEGAEERQLFRGSAATTLLPELLPILDGTRTIPDLIDALPNFPSEAITNAVALLYTRGVHEDAPPDGGPFDYGAPPDEVRLFLGRHVDTTRVNACAEAAWARLAGTRLLILGPEDAACLLDSELRACGLARIRRSRLDEAHVDLAADLVVVLITHTEDTLALRALDRRCSERGIRWLRTAMRGRRLELGPSFRPPESSCYDCFLRVYAPVPDPDSVTPHDLRAWVALVATEVIYMAGRVCTSVGLRELASYDLIDWSASRLKIPRCPGCTRCCRVPALREARDPELAFAYEQSVRFPAKYLLDPKDHQIHYAPANLELQTDQKRFPASPLVELTRGEKQPEPEGGFLEQLCDVPPGGINSPDAATLGGLLCRGAGLRGEHTFDGSKVQRWAPTGGNLGSVQIYVLAKDVADLSPGIYFFQPRGSELARVRPIRTVGQVEALIRHALGDEARDCAAALVLTGALGRVGMKYGTFGYRIIHLDAGVAVAQLQAVARGYGLRLDAATKWIDHLIGGELGIDTRSEPITSVLLLRHAQSAFEERPS